MASTNQEVAGAAAGVRRAARSHRGDQFRARNYEKAAKSVAGYPEDLGAVPEAALTKVPGVGPKRALQLARELGITSVSDLRDALRTVAPDATVDDIGAVLAAHVAAAETGRAEQAPFWGKILSRSLTCAVTWTRTPTSPTASSPSRG